MARTRRDVLELALGAGVVAPIAGLAAWPVLGRAAIDGLAGAAGGAEEVARDEALWRPVAASFARDGDSIYLNTAGVGPAADQVAGRYLRLLRESNSNPSRTLWDVLEPRREDVRRRLAALLGCDAEEVALTRGASEALEICQLGLDVRAGDEVLATEHEYPRMLDCFRQREHRDGIVLKTVPVPVPLANPEALAAAVAERITPRTRLILVSEMVNLTGQMLPVAAICRLAHARGVPVLVDGAQTLGQVPADSPAASASRADFYGASLHKWLGAPVGTGVLAVRRERIADLWPLMAAPEAARADIRKFEQVGTQPLAALLAVGDALEAHAAIGAERKAARLRYLRGLWVTPLLGEERVRFLTNLDPAWSCGIATFQVAGLEAEALARWLWDRHRIVVQAIRHPRDPVLAGVRVAAGLDVLPRDLERLGGALELALRSGLV